MYKSIRFSQIRSMVECGVIAVPYRSYRICNVGGLGKYIATMVVKGELGARLGNWVRRGTIKEPLRCEAPLEPRRAT